MKDWIDEGSTTVYTLWLGYVAQSAPLPSRHPISVVNVRQPHAIHHRFTVGGEKTAPRAPGRLFLTLMSMMHKVVLPPHSGIPGVKPETDFHARKVPRFNTGGER